MTLGSTALGSAALGSTVESGGQTLAAGTATSTTAGQPATLSPTATTLDGTVGTSATAGQPATVTPGVATLSAAAGTSTTTGQTATLVAALILQASTGASTTAGQAATLTPDTTALAAAVGTGTTSGQSATLAPDATTLTATAGLSTTTALAASVALPSPTTQTVVRSINWQETYTRPIDISTMSDIDDIDDYTQGESLTEHLPTTKDGEDYDPSSATLSWYLLPIDSSDISEAVLSDDDSGISLTATDANSDGTDDRITLSIDQGVTDGLAGYYTQLLTIDDSGPGLAKLSGNFRIKEI